MSNPNPFDFSDFGPPKRPSQPGAPAGAPPAPQSGGFDPWAGQPPAQPRTHQTHPQDAFGAAPDPGGYAAVDAFGQPAAVAPGATLQTAGPPLIWFAVALGLALLGVIIGVLGAVLGLGWPTAVGGWLLAGPIAIGALALYTRVDTRRRTEFIYSAPGWTTTLYWVVLAVCLVGIAVGAWQIALWAGRL
jgi:hypothetical protein